MKFSEVREAQPLPFDSVKQNLREQLEQDKTNEIEAKIVKDAKVKIVIKLKEAVEPKKAETAAEAAPAAIEPVEIEPAAIDAESIAAEEPKEIKNDKKNKKQ